MKKRDRFPAGTSGHCIVFMYPLRRYLHFLLASTKYNGVKGTRNGSKGKIIAVRNKLPRQ
jgi:hypothetical protein